MKQKSDGMADHLILFDNKPSLIYLPKQTCSKHKSRAVVIVLADLTSSFLGRSLRNSKSVYAHPSGSYEASISGASRLCAEKRCGCAWADQVREPWRCTATCPGCSLLMRCELRQPFLLHWFIKCMLKEVGHS